MGELELELVAPVANDVVDQNIDNRFGPLKAIAQPFAKAYKK